MLDAKHLLWLAEIVDLGSMSRAATKLHVTQPTLTRAVQVIEDHVGAVVLEREARGVRPTNIGGRLVEIGRKIAENRTHAEDVVDLWKDGLERELQIGVGPMLATSIMGGFFVETIKDPPPYALRVVSATVSRLIERLNNEELDLVLAPEQMHLYQDDLVQSLMMEDELAIFAGEQNPLAGSSSPVSIKELENSTWVTVGALSAIYGSNKEVLAQLGLFSVPIKIAFTGDINMVLEILAKTNALCILPHRLTMMSDVARGLVSINVEGNLPKRNIAFWTRRVDRDRPDLVNFKKRLTSYLEEVVRSKLHEN